MRFLTFLFMLWCAPAFAETTQYFTALEEVPMMRGMQEIPAETVYFESPHGRIIKVAALTTKGREETIAFYRDSLKALGWTTTDGRVYTREGETMTVDYQAVDGRPRVTFNLTPHQ